MSTATDTISKVNFDAIPQELKTLRQWVLWKKAVRKGKWTKVPYQVNGREASTNKPRTWTVFQLVALELATKPDKWDGIGFVFSQDDPYFGVDLDKVIDGQTGEFRPWPASLTEKCSEPLPNPQTIISGLNTYTEVSPSGTGTHSIGRGTLPGKGNRKDGQTAGIEMYDRGRYFCFTGNRLPTAPAEIRECNGKLTRLHEIVFGSGKSGNVEKETAARDKSERASSRDMTDAELLDKAFAASNGANLQSLWNGDISAYPSASEADLALANGLAFWCGPSGEARVKDLMQRSGLARDKWSNHKTYLDDTIAKAFEGRTEFYEPRPRKNSSETVSSSSDDETVEVNEAIDDPHRLARLYLARKTGDESQTIHFYRSEWHKWDGYAYQPVEDVEVRAELGELAKSEFDEANRRAIADYNEAKDAGEINPLEDKGPPLCRKVTRGLLNNVVQALESLTLLPGSMEQPAWLGDKKPFPADEVLATRSGLIHLPSLIQSDAKPLPPTPLYFSRNALQFGYDPDADCPLWRKFLSTLWPDDAESLATLQQWFGYCLLPSTEQHKMMMLVGPPRSGKGTIGRVLQQLIGKTNVANPKLASLEGPFGLQPLVGKLVGLVSDARLSGRVDGVAVVENLLSISGEDSQDVHRKNLPTLTGVRLPIRFMILTNELPNMRDVSGALITRVILLRLVEDFIGREDKTLTARLLTELPGILNWAIAGWDRLQQEGGFIQPESGRELLEDLEGLASPVKTFVGDCCEIGPECTDFCDVIFRAWQDWCETHGRDHTGTVQTFGRDLRAAFPHIRTMQPRIYGSRQRTYQGIKKR